MRTYVSTSYIQKDQEFVASIDVSSVSLCTSCWKNTDRIAVSYTSLSLPPPHRAIRHTNSGQNLLLENR